MRNAQDGCFQTPNARRSETILPEIRRLTMLFLALADLGRHAGARKAGAKESAAESELSISMPLPFQRLR